MKEGKVGCEGGVVEEWEGEDSEVVVSSNKLLRKKLVYESV